MWFNETLACGMVPYHHIIGGENGMGEDRRWLEDRRRNISIGRRSTTPTSSTSARSRISAWSWASAPTCSTSRRAARSMRRYMDGMYYALLEGRFLFDFVHEDKLEPKELAKYSALLLPNTALLSDEQCRQLRAYVDGGGSLLATFETSLYTRAQPAARGFRPGGRIRHSRGRPAIGRGTNGNAYSGAHREAASILTASRTRTGFPARKTACRWRRWRTRS